jgi:transposase
MSRRQNNPLRPLTSTERTELERVGRAQVAPVTVVVHAKALLAVAAGQTYTAAARTVGLRSGDSVAQLVARFNQSGLAAIEPRHGGGQPKRYTGAEQERILREVRREPDREMDRTATWSLTTLQRVLRQAPDGLPTVSTFTIWSVLHDAGFGWGKDRSWCATGTAPRKRKSGTVTVYDPDATAKKT